MHACTFHILHSGHPLTQCVVWPLPRPLLVSSKFTIQYITIPLYQPYQPEQISVIWNVHMPATYHDMVPWDARTLATLYVLKSCSNMKIQLTAGMRRGPGYKSTILEVFFLFWGFCSTWGILGSYIILYSNFMTILELKETRFLPGFGYKSTLELIIERKYLVRRSYAMLSSHLVDHMLWMGVVYVNLIR